METPQQDSPRKPSTVKKILIYSSIFVVGVGTGFGLRHIAASSVNTKLNKVTAERNDSVAKQAELKKNNENLTKAIEVLQKQINEQADGTDDITAAELAGSISITSFAREALTVAATDTKPQTSYDHLAVHATIKNLTGSNQFYTLDNFSAVTTAGAIVRPESFGPGIEQPIWNSSTLVPEGHQDVVVYFEIGQSLATLNWTAPGGTEIITVPLPPLKQ